jgi:hypothetical protein
VYPGVTMANPSNDAIFGAHCLAKSRHPTIEIAAAYHGALSKGEAEGAQRSGNQAVDRERRERARREVPRKKAHR